MLRYLHAGDLGRYPALARTMHLDRASQFRHRLGWEVTVDASGEERDGYDAFDPLYVIWQGPDGRHGGSMRFLPTTGDTMVNDHFPHLTGGARIEDPGIWECTRFCLSPDAGPRVSAALMLGGLELGLRMGLSRAVGVFDARMRRVYGALGWQPEILGTSGTGREAIAVGLWTFEPDLRGSLLRRAGISAELSRHWLTRHLGPAAGIPRTA